MVTSPRVVVLYGTKGGSCKTSHCGNLGALCADAGLRTLLVDADPQGSLGSFYVLRNEAPYGFVELVQRTQPLEECVSQTVHEGLDVVVGNEFERRLEMWIQGATNRGAALRVALAPARERYDVIIVDTQGAEGMAKAQELALRAADYVLMPVVPDALVVRELTHNAFSLLDRLQPMDGDDSVRRIPPPHVVISRVKPRGRSHRVFVDGLTQWLDEAQEAGRAVLLQTQIPESVAYNDAQSVSPTVPAHRFDRTPRRDQLIPCAAESMVSLASEVWPEFAEQFARFMPSEAKIDGDVQAGDRPAVALDVVADERGHL